MESTREFFPNNCNSIIIKISLLVRNSKRYWNSKTVVSALGLHFNVWCNIRFIAVRICYSVVHELHHACMHHNVQANSKSLESCGWIDIQLKPNGPLLKWRWFAMPEACKGQKSATTITDGTQLMILLLGRRNSCVFFLYCKLNLVKRLLECDKYVKRTFLLPQVFIWYVCFKEACQKNKLVTEPWQRAHFSLACSIVTYFSRSPTTSAVLFFQDGPRWQV